MSTVTVDKDDQQIIHLVLDKPNVTANLMDKDFADAFTLAVANVQQQDCRGVILRSAKDTFFSGGDLTMLASVDEHNATELFTMLEQIKTAMRQLELLGKPVVACLTGAALGGGWELALACHRRIAVDTPSVRLGLPEVTLGLMPGAGGITRLTRLLGIKTALPLLTEGKVLSAAQASSAGLIDQLVNSAKEAYIEAERWILQAPETQQPWDTKGYRLPGGDLHEASIINQLPVLPAILRKQTQGVLPAPETILATMIEGLQVEFDCATRIESRKFVALACRPEAKNMINTFWFQLNEIKRTVAVSSDSAKPTINKVAIIGAGMMGAGIAYTCAKSGLQVVLKDVDKSTAEKGKDYSRRLLTKQVEKNKTTRQLADQMLARIYPTDEISAIEECQLVIEAVFEDRSLKTAITQEAEQHLNAEVIMASNTSTLPISSLANASAHPARFIGLHFFSPVDKMPLVEIIRGQHTSDTTLAQCYQFVLQLGKTPIVVNDSRSFYTSRVFETYVSEGVGMLAEGIAAPSVENAAYLCGFKVGPLAVTDEVSLTLIDRIKRQTQQDFEADGKPYKPHPADGILAEMLVAGRSGKTAGQGFYDYPPEQQKVLWPGLSRFGRDSNAPVPLTDIKDRLLFIMAIETARCLEEGVIESAKDANIGSIFGIGFPSWTGGTIQFINQYGLVPFVARAEQLASRYGPRFAPSQWLKDKAQQGATL